MHKSGSDDGNTSRCLSHFKILRPQNHSMFKALIQNLPVSTNHFRTPGSTHSDHSLAAQSHQGALALINKSNKGCSQGHTSDIFRRFFGWQHWRVTHFCWKKQHSFHFSPNLGWFTLIFYRLSEKFPGLIAWWWYRMTQCPSKYHKISPCL